MPINTSTGPVIQKTTNTSYEHIPFTEIASTQVANPVDNLNDYSLYRKISTDVTLQTVNKVTTTLSSDKNEEPWAVIHNKDLKALINGKDKKKKEKIFFSYISESTLNNIKQQGYLSNTENLFYDNSLFKFNPQDFSSEKMCLIKVYQTALSQLIFEAEKDTFIPVSISLNNHLVTSEYWDLEPLVDKLILNPQIRFLIKEENTRNFRVADITKENDVKGIIQKVPYYNQNSDDDLEEIFVSYILSQEQMHALLKAKNHGYDWVNEFIQDNNPHFTLSELQKLPIYEGARILAFLCDGLEYSTAYKDALAAKNPKAPEVLATQSKYRR